MASEKGNGRVGALVIIGGHEEKDGPAEILNEFLRLAGGEKARLVIMPVASESPEEAGKNYIKAFRGLGSPEVQVVDVSSREMAFDGARGEALRTATGVFFTGGSQVRIASMLGGSPLDQLLMQRQSREGLVIGGTSAGASIMADTMIVAGDADGVPKISGLELGSGLGFIHNVIIDQHFAERGRVNRLLSAVAQNPRYLGLGIDEDTALIFEGNIFRVMGKGAVTVLDACSMQYNNFTAVGDDEALALEGVRLTIVPPGYRFNCDERTLVRDDDKREDDKPAEPKAQAKSKGK